MPKSSEKEFLERREYPATNAKPEELDLLFKDTAYLDPLTSFPNRLFFEKIVAFNLEKARQADQMLALLMLDIDHFKAVNETYGHHVGDLLLIEVTKRLQNIVRHGDFIGRLGDDEFAIVMLGLHSIHEAGVVAGKIIKTLNQDFQLEKETVSVGVSIGVVVYPHCAKFPYQSQGDVIQNAEVAMSQAKENGGNNYQYMTSEINASHTRHLQLLRELNFALERNELSLAYQPVYELKSRRIIGMEVLLRWHHPALGDVSPVEFIPVAEESGLILPIGEWVIQQACQAIKKELKPYCADCFLSINVSPIQLMRLQTDFPKVVRKILKEHKISSKNIEFELTESVFMAHPHMAESILKKLQHEGIRIAIDDFGTAYSSLARLKLLPISTLKIDQSFVQDLEKDENSQVIVNTIISLAKTLDLKVVAEGIETKSQLDFLIKNGCYAGQGFYFSKPLPIEEAIKLL